MSARLSARYRQLAAHVRTLPDDDLNDLLVDLPRHRFASLVDAALAHPVMPAGLELRLRSAAPAEAWTVLAGLPVRPLGTVTRGHPDGDAGRAGWRAWTRGGHPVAIGGLCWWRRRADAAGALAWVTPASGARCLVLAAHVRTLDDLALNDLLVELPADRFDALLDATFPQAKGEAA
jgi:hypothetical protein